MSEAASRERMSFRTAARRAHASAWDERAEVSGGDLDRDLPQLLAPLQSLECGPCFRKGEDPVYDRAQLARAEQAYDLAIFGVVSHGGAHDAPLIPEQSAHVEPDLGSGRRAAAHQPPAAPERAQRFIPCGLAHVLDHHVGAALAREGAHLLGDL